MRRRRGTAGARLGLALVAGALLAPAAATAAPVPLAPVDLSAPDGAATGARPALDGAGGAVVVWQRAAGDDTRVQAATRAPAGAWTAPVDLSAPGDVVATPHVAVAPDGAAVAVWRRDGDDGTVIHAAARPPGGAFAAAAEVSAAGAFAPQVAIAPSGAAAAAWLRFDDGRVVVEAATRPAGGAFSAPRRVSAAGGNALALQVAVDDSGQAVVVWNQASGSAAVVRAGWGTGEAGFSDPVDVSAGDGTAFDAQVALAPSGAGAIAWTRARGDGVSVVEASLRDASGALSAPARLSAEGVDGAAPQVGVDASGAAVATWLREPEGRAVVRAALREPSGGFGAPVDVSAAGVRAAEPRLAVDRAGLAVVAWRRADGADPRVQMAGRAPGGAWTAPQDVSRRGVVVGEPRVALDGTGNGLVTWRRASGEDDIVQAAGLDGAPPVIQELAAPAAGTAGRPMAFAVSSYDVWSPVAPPRWSFGAAAGASGATVSHVFPAAGAHAVRVSQADELGNVAVAERTVAISAAPRPPAAPPPSTGATRQSLRLSAAPARRAVALRAGFATVRRGPRVFLRVRGRAAPALRGRAVIVERRAGRRTARVCRAVVTRRGSFDRLCRIDHLMRGAAPTIRLRVRARVAATRTTRARALPYVTRRIGVPAALRSRG